MQKLRFSSVHVGSHPDTPLRFTDADLCDECHRLRVIRPDVRAALIQRMEECGRCKIVNLLHASTCTCDAQKARQAEERLYYANLPPPRDGTARTFTSFHKRDGTEDALRAAQNWSVGQGAPLLFLQGRQGTGKSHLIEAALREAHSRDRSIRYEYTPDLLSVLRPSEVEGHDERQKETLYWVEQAEYLGLDDIGAEKPSEFVREQLLRVIDSRIRYGRRLIVATNLMQSRMLEHLGPRIHDRLYDKDAERVKSVALSCESFRTGR